MRIHISESCNECLRGTDFETEFRGLIELKVLIYKMRGYMLKKDILTELFIWT